MTTFDLKEFKKHLQSELNKAKKEADDLFKSEAPLKDKGFAIGYERALSNVLYSLSDKKEGK